MEAATMPVLTEPEEYRHVKVPIPLENLVREARPELNGLNTGAMVQLGLLLLAGSAVTEIARALSEKK